ncbi:PH domain-containing protein [Patescibacteria group bacterium]|nr:PH domain-containing protein [Patescibacteria group bacterium]
MFGLDSILQLKEDETIQAFIRRHLATLFPTLGLAMFLIVMPFFFLFPLFSLGVAGVLIFGVIVIIGILIAIRAFILWEADVMVITNLRVVDVDQNGLLSRHVTEASLSAIQDVSWKRQGMWQTVFRMGSVSIQTAGTTATIEAERIPKPQKVHELINDLRQDVAVSPIAPQPQLTTKEEPTQKDRKARIKNIAYLMDQVDDDIIVKVEHYLEKKLKNDSMSALFDKNNES